MPDLQLLDEIKEAFCLKNDSKLANFLSLSRASIHKIRLKPGKLGFLSRLKVMDHIAFLGRTGWHDLITTDELERKMRQYAVELSKSTPGSVSELNFIDVVKTVFAFPSDEALADFLGLKRHSISTIRSGRSDLGHKPRLKILNRIEPFDLAQVESVLESSDALITAIRTWKNGHQSSL